MLVTTQRGWAIRQALKLATLAGASCVSWLAARGIHLDNSEVVITALGTLAVGLAEFGLSAVTAYIRDDK